jgi:hypothetical protein
MMMIMKIKLLVALAFLLCTSLSLAVEPILVPTQNPDSPYRLFNTQNIYTLLKLDTSSGRIWQVQWGDKDHRLTSPLNESALVSDGKPGRFTLYPTTNIFTFILLDQQTGDAWHVQWGDKEDRFIQYID